MRKSLAVLLAWLRGWCLAPWRWHVARRKPEVDPGQRRLAMSAGVAALAGGLVGLTGARRADASAPPDPGPVTGRRWGMSIDLDSCTGCNSCQIACRQENNIPTQGPEAKYGAGHIEWMSMLWKEPEDELAPPELLPFPCQHCDDAPCVKVCPVGATYQDSEGIVVQVWDRCIGCRYCMVACPYERRSFNWEEPKFEGSLAQMLNPDVATRTAGIVEKCTFCSHRLQGVKEEARLEERAMRDSELQDMPACAASCPAEAITFGDLNDPESAVAKDRRSPRVFRLLEHLGTDPKVFYLRRDRGEDS